jgi:hypothetical protein
VEQRSFGPQGFFHRLGIFLAIIAFFFLVMDGGFQTARLPPALIVGGAIYALFFGLGWVLRL